MGADPWTDTQLDLLRSDWRDPSNTLSAIASRINAETGSGFSRSAIAGKAKRLNLPLRRKPNGQSNRRTDPVNRKPSTRAVNVARIGRPRSQPLARTAMPAGEPAHLGLTVLQVNEATCKFPRGDEVKTFCGQASQDGSPYCVFHHKLCYTPPERRPFVPFRRAA